jgi:hypothetical protein
MYLKEYLEYFSRNPACVEYFTFDRHGSRRREAVVELEGAGVELGGQKGRQQGKEGGDKDASGTRKVNVSLQDPVAHH